VTNFKLMILMNLATPKAAAKHGLLFNELASASCYGLLISKLDLSSINMDKFISMSFKKLRKVC
jgi:hypothetical protein